MHLNLVSVSFGSSTLGILGVNSANNRVTFILRTREPKSNLILSTYWFEKKEPTDCGKDTDGSSYVIFTISTNGKLRNPKRYLWSVVRKMQSNSSSTHEKQIIDILKYMQPLPPKGGERSTELLTKQTEYIERLKLFSKMSDEEKWGDERYRDTYYKVEVCKAIMEATDAINVHKLMRGLRHRDKCMYICDFANACGLISRNYLGLQVPDSWDLVVLTQS